MHIVVLPGDDIGPEITAATRQVHEVLDEKLALALKLDEQPMGFATLDSHARAAPFVANVSPLEIWRPSS